MRRPKSFDLPTVKHGSRVPLLLCREFVVGDQQLSLLRRLLLLLFCMILDVVSVVDGRAEHGGLERGLVQPAHLWRVVVTENPGYAQLTCIVQQSSQAGMVDVLS